MERDYEGKNVERIVKYETSIEIHFTDGTKLEIWAFGTEDVWIAVNEFD